jgi:hypothetical protein
MTARLCRLALPRMNYFSFFLIFKKNKNMAISKGILKMSGGFGTASCYFLPGSDKMIVRAKGGPKARRMKVGPEFEKVRKHQVEWKACVLFSQAVKLALGDVYPLADYNVSPVWNGLGKNILKTDTEHIVGERSLLVSTYKQELKGFSLNRNYMLNALLGVQPAIQVDTEKMYASVRFPAFNTSRELLNVRKLPYFRIIVCFGIVSDYYFTPDNRYSKYLPKHDWASGLSMSKSSEWLSTNDMIAEQLFEIQYDEYFTKQEHESLTYLLSIGVEFGAVGFGGKIEGVKYAGAGKIIDVF